MSSLDHIVLFLLLFFVFFLITRLSQSVINRNYWIIVSIPMILYSVIIGCRYGWGPDYLEYKYVIDHPFAYISMDVGWLYFNGFLSYIGLNYVECFIIYGFIFAFAGFIMLKTYRENKYMLALFLPATLDFFTSPIRQAFAHVFVFISIYLLNKKRWLVVPFMIPFIYWIHPGGLVTIFVCFVLYCICSRPFPIQLSIPVFAFVSIFYYGAAEWITKQLPDMMQLLPFNEAFIGSRYQGYFYSSEQWFGIGGLQDERIQSNFAFFLMTFYHTGIIYLGYVALKYLPNRNIAYIYNANVVGIILFRLFFLFEILKRIAVPLEILLIVSLGYGFWGYTQLKSQMVKKERILTRMSVIGVLTYLILFHGRFVFIFPKSGFVWN